MPGEMLQWSSAEQPAEPYHANSALPFRTAFYDTGWNVQGQKENGANIVQQVEQIIVEHDLGAFGVCKVFEIDDDLNKQRNVLSSILSHLNNTVQLAWAGRADAIICLHRVF